MRSGCLTMSKKELDRLTVITRVTERSMKQDVAADALKLSLRQIQRLCMQFRRDGAPGLISKKRGRVSNRKLDDGFHERVISLVSEHYADFGPTLAREKLIERHGIKIGCETLRRWMTAAGIWLPKAERQRRPYQPRNRRECYGELIQIDGSPHAWFEDRGPKCTLLVYIDDATSRLMELRMVDTESAFDYFEATKSYLSRHGKPVAFYSDKHSIFRVNKGGATSDDGRITQFGRALEVLNIDIICANTPQAKGRVERANRTLQDRLLRELRLEGISTMEDANAFMPSYVERFNEQFARVPTNPHDAHRALRDDEDLNAVFSWQEERTLSRELVLHYKNRRYLIEPSKRNQAFGGKRCLVYEWLDGEVEIRCEGTTLPYRVLDKNPRVQQATVVENKRLAAALEFIKSKQDLRDAERLASPKITKRRKKRIVAEIQRAGEHELP